MITLREQLKTFVGDDLSLVEHYSLGVPSDKYDPWTEKVSLQGTNLEEQAEILDRRFDDGYGGTNGPSVLIYTKDEVIFSVCYDGAEWLASLPRNPPNETFVPEFHGGG